MGPALLKSSYLMKAFVGKTLGVLVQMPAPEGWKEMTLEGAAAVVVLLLSLHPYIICRSDH
jgi:hypothetical protein